MEKRELLLKYISSSPDGNLKKYLIDFLDGSLYMNTLSYFWNEPYMHSAEIKAEDIIDCDSEGNPIGRLLPHGQRDVLEGSVASKYKRDAEISDWLKKHMLADVIYRGVGLGYANVLSFYKLEYQIRTDKNKSIGAYYDMSESMRKFGDFVVIVEKPMELVRRIGKAARREGYRYICESVHYREPEKNGKPIQRRNSVTFHVDQEFKLTELEKIHVHKGGCFDKFQAYAEQHEWRVILYRGEKTTEPYRLEIGDIRDICYWTTVSRLVDVLDRDFGSLRNLPIEEQSFGNISRDEMIDLFLELGDDKVVPFVGLG